MTKKSEIDHQGLETLIHQAKGGDRDALEQVVRVVQDPVYGLSLRMLGEPVEAEDATQEILVKVVTRLDSFRGESRFMTWVFAVAANHLRTMRARGLENRQTSFEQMVENLDRWMPEARPPTVERTVLTREIRLLCLHGMMLSLDRDHRLAFALGEGLELDGVEGAQVLGIEPAAFRKRLSRARQRIQQFMTENCGLTRPENRCHCELWCDPAVETGTVDPERPKLAEHPANDQRDEDLKERLAGLDELGRISALFRSLPEYRAPEYLVKELTEMLIVEPAREPDA